MSIAFITPRPLWFAFASRASYNLTRCLMRATHSHQETQVSADSVPRCATGSAPSGTGAPWGCAGSTAPRTCLSAVASSTTLSPAVAAHVPTRSLASTLGHTSWCNLLTWNSEQKFQPLSRQCSTRDTWHRTSPCSSPSSQPVTCLAATARAWPSDRRRPGGGPRPPQGARKPRAWSPW